MKNLSILLHSILPAVFLALVPAFAANAADDGFSLYRQGQYAKAAEAFARADMDRPDETRFRYNRGVAALKAKDAEAGTAALESAYSRSDDPEVRYRSAYNLGNSLFEKKDYRSAAEYYKKALTVKPGDPDAKANFQLALWRAAQAEKKKDQGQDDKGSQKDGGKKKGDKGKTGANGGNRTQGEDDKKERAEEGKQGQDKDGRDKDGQSRRHKPEENAGGKKEDGSKGADTPQPANPQDLKGSLRAEGARPGAAREEKGQPAKAADMERIRAESMVENVEEDPKLLFREIMGQSAANGSGKSW